VICYSANFKLGDCKTRRREFIAGFGGTVAWPAAALERTIPVVGVLGSSTADGYALVIAGFMRMLKEAGFIHGQNLAVEQRWASNQYDRLSEIADDLVRARVSPILAVGKGFVQSLSQPGRNITGFTNLEASVGSKMLQLLKEIDPQIVRVVVIYNPQTAPFARSYVRPMESALASLGVETIAMPLQNDSDIEAAMMPAARPGGGLVAIPDTYTSERRDLVVTLARRLRLPAIYGSLSFARSGGLMAYAVDARDLMRRAARYVDRILRAPDWRTSRSACRQSLGWPSTYRPPRHSG
jgi:putative tryptophan/tyrosine transport system substrate-binding protein